MDKTEAAKNLSEHLQRYGSRSFAELAELVADKHTDCFCVTGQSGTEYQIEIQCLWDSKPGGAIRVIGTIDDGGWRAFVPMTGNLLVLPTDSEDDAKREK